MTTHAADRLLEAIDRCGAPVCVGIDPVMERLPRGIDAGDPARALRSFTLGVLDAVAGAVPCVKFQSACYERYRHDGVRALEKLIAESKARGLEVILDAKRGDIGITAEHYAAAAFGGTSADWLTINSYLGADGIEPFLVEGRGAFALVRTSNPGGDALQSQRLADGRTVGESVAAMVAKLGARCVGDRGCSALGAVVGATKAAEAAALRELMPQQMFLVPGYGAQGGSAEDVRPCFNFDERGRGSGAIVAASRSVIYAYESTGGGKWTEAVRAAAERFADELGAVAGLR